MKIMSLFLIITLFIFGSRIEATECQLVSPLPGVTIPKNNKTFLVYHVKTTGAPYYYLCHIMDIEAQQYIVHDAKSRIISLAINQLFIAVGTGLGVGTFGFLACVLPSERSFAYAGIATSALVGTLLYGLLTHSESAFCKKYDFYKKYEGLTCLHFRETLDVLKAMDSCADRRLQEIISRGSLNCTLLLEQLSCSPCAKLVTQGPPSRQRDLFRARNMQDQSLHYAYKINTEPNFD